MAPDSNILDFLKEWVIIPASIVLGWAWNRNEQEHQAMRERTETLKQHTADGYSVFNDRVMSYVDEKVVDVRDEQRRRSDKLAEHIEKLFTNAEKDRAAFREELARHSQQSSERHIELLSAIHTGLAGKADK